MINTGKKKLFCAKKLPAHLALCLLFTLLTCGCKESSSSPQPVSSPFEGKWSETYEHTSPLEWEWGEPDTATSTLEFTGNDFSLMISRKNSLFSKYCRGSYSVSRDTLKLLAEGLTAPERFIFRINGDSLKLWAAPHVALGDSALVISISSYLWDGAMRNGIFIRSKTAGAK